MNNKEFGDRWKAISEQIENLKAIPDPVTNRVAEVKIVDRGIDFLDVYNLQDLLDENEYLLCCRLIRDRIETEIMRLEGQLEHLTREWLSCVELRRNEEVTA